jgi:plasmid maintenance system antidote protein VapI
VDALGLRADTWMNLETNYRLTRVRLARKARRQSR